jgi:DNA-binding transcriptional MerR regulator
MSDLVSIREVAQTYGLTLRALRFYEVKGLLKPEREGSRRLYRPQDLERVAIITKLTAAGFTLRQAREVVETEDLTLKRQRTAEIAAKVRERLSANQKTLISQARALEKLL